MEKELERYRRFFEEVKDSACCKVCEEFMSDNPSTLDCGHTFCLLCVSQLKEKICPLCQAAYARASVTRNFIVSGIASLCEGFERDLNIAPPMNDSSTPSDPRRYLTGKRAATSIPTPPPRRRSISHDPSDPEGLTGGNSFNPPTPTPIPTPDPPSPKISFQELETSDDSAFAGLPPGMFSGLTDGWILDSLVVPPLQLDGPVPLTLAVSGLNTPTNSIFATKELALSYQRNTVPGKSRNRKFSYCPPETPCMNCAIYVHRWTADPNTRHREKCCWKDLALGVN